MKERPILFSAAMVRAILEGRKTQTRRVIKPQPDNGCDEFERGMVNEAWQAGEIPIKCPYGKPGDRLWVRETMHRDEAGPWHYSADCETVTVGKENETEMRVWAHHKEGDTCVSIHMPRWASRITLEVIGVRVERVQEISEQDAKAEGVLNGLSCTIQDKADGYRDSYAVLWNDINAERGFGWDVNPWVWVIQFRRVGL